MAKARKQAMPLRRQLKAIFRVAALTFRLAPFAVIFKLTGSFVDAVLPIATTYFAAKTTTTLAAAYGGDNRAGGLAIVYVIITAVLGLVMIAWRSVDQWVQTSMRYVVETRVSQRMYEHFLSLDFWRYDDKDTADMYDRALKFSNFFAWVFDRIASIVSALITVIGAVIALAFVNLGVALLIVLALVPGIYFQFKLSREQVRHWNENIEVRRSLSFIEWNILQPRLIAELRLYGMVNYLLRLRTKLRDKDEKQRMEIERRSLPLRLGSDVLEAAAEAAALVWITLEIIHRQQPLGQFVYVQQLVSRAMYSANQLVGIIGSIDEDIANLFDYENFMELPVRRGGARKLTQPPARISLQDVSFHYRGGDQHEVLKGISFDIPRGQHVAIVGENGAGKSTLIKLLTGLYKPTRGQILLDGEPIETFDLASWHKQIGILQQEFIEYAFATARDNVRYGDIEGQYSEERLEHALKQAEAHDFLAKLPKGLDSFINNWMEDDDGNKGSDLSGGQWQRVALARNFYRNAPIIILDEPTSAIDAVAEARIFKHLFNGDDRTVLAISHRLSTVRKADVILVIKNGKLVERGTYSELIDKQGEFYRMFESQLMT